MATIAVTRRVRPDRRAVGGAGAAAADAAGLITWDVSVDSTIARAHQHAAVARRCLQQVEPPGGVAAKPADHALGRSRGGWTTKLHLACDQGGKPLSLLLSRPESAAAGGRHVALRGRVLHVVPWIRVQRPKRLCPHPLDPGV